MNLKNMTYSLLLILSIFSNQTVAIDIEKDEFRRSMRNAGLIRFDTEMLVPVSESAIFTFKCRDESKVGEINALGSRLSEFRGKRILASTFSWEVIRVGLQIGDRLIFIGRDLSVRDVFSNEVKYYMLEPTSIIVRDLKKLAHKCG